MFFKRHPKLTTVAWFIITVIIYTIVRNHWNTWNAGYFVGMGLITTYYILHDYLRKK